MEKFREMSSNRKLIHYLGDKGLKMHCLQMKLYVLLHIQVVSISYIFTGNKIVKIIHIYLKKLINNTPN